MHPHAVHIHPVHIHPMCIHPVRSSSMYAALAEQLMRSGLAERQRQAKADNLAARVAIARKWERRAASSARRARLARAAIG